MLAVLAGYSQMVHHTPPAIETSQHASDHFTVVFGEQEQVRVAFQFPCDLFWFVGASHMDARTGGLP
jgi:hypothetical protein